MGLPLATRGETRGAARAARWKTFVGSGATRGRRRVSTRYSLQHRFPPLVMIPGVYIPKTRQMAIRARDDTYDRKPIHTYSFHFVIYIYIYIYRRMDINYFLMVFYRSTMTPHPTP